MFLVFDGTNFRQQGALAGLRSSSPRTMLCIVPLSLSMVVPSFESFLQRSTGAWRGAGYTWSPAEPSVGAAMPLGAAPSVGSWLLAVISSLASPAPKASAVAICGAEGARRGRPSAPWVWAFGPITCHAAKFLHSGVVEGFITPPAVSSCEVSEVMRSCGGAVQGVSEERQQPMSGSVALNRQVDGQ